MTDLDLDAIEARANAATDGPWDIGHTLNRHDYVIANQQGSYLQGVGAIGDDGKLNLGQGEQAAADAEFIAHARTDVPALVAEVRHLRGIVKEMHGDEDQP